MWSNTAVNSFVGGVSASTQEQENTYVTCGEPCVA